MALIISHFQESLFSSFFFPTKLLLLIKMRFSKALTLISVVTVAVAVPHAHDHPYENGGSTGVSTANGGSTGSAGSTGGGGAAPQQPATALCEESLGALNCCQSQQKMDTESLLPALTNSLGSLGGLLDILVQLLLPVVLPVGLSCMSSPSYLRQEIHPADLLLHRHYRLG